jgi:Cys-tRNA(Pro)/Cys-tRNA(Cys) deacylase
MDLESYLRAQNIPFEFIPKPHTVHTADAASATGIPLAQITKALVCLGSDGNAYVAIIPGTHKLRLKQVARAFGLKSVQLCPFTEAHQHTGYPPGATPPLHYRNIAGVVMDETLLQFENIHGGGGTNELLLKVRAQDAVRLNNARIANVAELPTGSL